MNNHNRLFFLCILYLVLVVGSASAEPIVEFNGIPTSGSAPLTVAFTDISTGSPTGWAWFFGDEKYSAPWTLVTANAEWGNVTGQTAVVMPDGSIVMMEGYHNSNKVWRSTDYGATWVLMNASPGYPEGAYDSSVVMPDGSIVLMVGHWGTGNETWRSTDYGATWTPMNKSSGWPVRWGHSSVVMPDGSIVLMGGMDSSFNGKNDTWRSTDYGATWVLMNASSGWSKRDLFSSVVLPDSSIVIIGGGDDYLPNYEPSNVWRSTDSGATWIKVNTTAGWKNRMGHSSVVMPDGSIVMMGGADGISGNNDVWRSTDGGITWVKLTASAGWTGRMTHSSVVMPDGSIVLFGGDGLSIQDNSNSDVWRFTPTGSSEQNPTHSYTAPGIYQVSLQAFNAIGYNSTRKSGYIRVIVPPIVNFTGTPTYGPAPLTVLFTDTSLVKSPTRWNWSFGDGQVFSTTGATQKNATHTYTNPGIYSVSLTVTNATTSYSLVRTGFIQVRELLMANFTANVTEGLIPLAVQFTDCSTGSPTGWNWSFGEGNFSEIQNPAYTYTSAGSYTVSLNVTNASGYNTTVKQEFIYAVPKDGNFTIALNHGWNFVSVPKTLKTGKNTALIFNDVDCAGHSIWLYNASAKQWTAMTETTKINVLDGIWVYSTTTISVPLSFKNDPLQTPPSKMCYPGWNAVGFSDVNPVSARNTLYSIQNKWATVIGYGSSHQLYEPSIINGATDDLHGDQLKMQPGKGYWLYMTDIGELAAISA